MKALAIIPAALIAAAPANAYVVDPGFSQGSINRGPAYAIRSCAREAYGPRVDVCYNEVISGEWFPFSRGVGLDYERSRVRQVACDRRHSLETRRGKIAAEFCPQVEAGTLAPAPFLM